MVAKIIKPGRKVRSMGPCVIAQRCLEAWLSVLPALAKDSCVQSEQTFIQSFGR